MKRDIPELVDRARKLVEAGCPEHARLIYRVIMQDTWPPVTGVERVAQGEACLHFARIARLENRFGEAVDWYLRALQVDPAAVEYRVEMILKAMLPYRMLQQARTEAERATRIDPKYGDAWRALGVIAHDQADVKTCVMAYDRLLALDPDDPHALLDRCTIALDTADYDLVRELCARVSGARKADALVVLGMVAHREGRHEDAIDLYQQGIDMGCGQPDLIRWNRSLSLHAIGRYLEGWPEHERRFHQTSNSAMSMTKMRFSQPIWNREPPNAGLPLTRIHLHEDMGYGDTLAMARYAKFLVDDGYDVTMEVREPMVKLMQDSFPSIAVGPKALNYPGVFGIKPFDYHVPMLSFPAIYKTDIDTVPWFGPYLKADPELVAQYRARLPTGRNVGLCWSSGIRDAVWIKEYGKRKSMRFDTLWPVLGCEGVGFVSLQAGPERADNTGAALDLLGKESPTGPIPPP
jgi:hypothetical protein